MPGKRVELSVSDHISRDLEQLQWTHQTTPGKAVSDGLTLLLGMYGLSGVDASLRFNPPLHTSSVTVMPPPYHPYEGVREVTITVAGKDLGILEQLTAELGCSEAQLLCHAIHVTRAIRAQQLAGGTVEPAG